MSTTRPVAITGARGQLGSAFRRLLPDAVGLARSELDLSDPAAISERLRSVNPSLVLNCAAYTAVDRAEEEEELATVINGAAVEAMAAWCRSSGARFVTFSTDYVFPGSGSAPYVESDATDPINAYGRSKLVGEHAALSHGGLVVRTSWLLSGQPPNFVASILSAAASRGTLKVVDDQTGCPTMASDLVRATLAAVDIEASGILHLTNEGSTTWFELARTAVEMAGMDPDLVTPCSSEEFPRPAPRPANSVLASERVADLGLSAMPSWRESLESVVNALLAAT